MTYYQNSPIRIEKIEEKKIELSEEGQKRYNDLKEGYITTFTQGLAGKLSESEVREIVEGVFEEPSIMKEFEEAYQYADEHLSYHSLLNTLKSGCLVWVVELRRNWQK